MAQRPLLFVLLATACLWLSTGPTGQPEVFVNVPSPTLRGAGSTVEAGSLPSQVIMKALPEPRPNDAMLPVELNRTSLYW
eukprot:CAMPEP_0114644874 /NCGR_PEP_ID=MMETSP0191-20121206/4218_1 /TAXON_ID=126664 /ORGANISM="Sorites sp." /LENGTH=79 /DNA_ID=CAMNT_0001857401 /DNA_START=36 /DNA_END=272 /DNA_ORIENTATION=+